MTTNTTGADRMRELSMGLDGALQRMRSGDESQFTDETKRLAGFVALEQSSANRMREEFESWCEASNAMPPAAKSAAWKAWQAAKRTPISPEPRKTLLTEGAIEAGVKAYEAHSDAFGHDKTDEVMVKAIFHAMEAQLPSFVPAAQEPEASHDDFKESVGLMLDAVGYTTEYALRWPEEKVSITFKRWFDEQIAKAATPAAQTDDLAFQYASSLATALFEKHFATDPDYTSGRVKWGLCDSTAGILTQIDNMASALVKPAAQTQEAATLSERLNWLADKMLYCDYGDNSAPGDLIGWGTQVRRRNAVPFMFGQSIDAAIDAARGFAPPATLQADTTDKSA